MTFFTSVFSDATLKGEALTEVVLCLNTMVSCGGWLEDTTVLSSLTHSSLVTVCTLFSTG
jgi:hypothetical protein